MNKLQCGMDNLLSHRAGTRHCPYYRSASQTPMHATAATWRRRIVAQEIFAPFAILLAIPKLHKWILEQVAHDEGLVILRGERRNAARQTVPIRGDVGSCPGTQARCPWTRI